MLDKRLMLCVCLCGFFTISSAEPEARDTTLELTTPDEVAFAYGLEALRDRLPEAALSALKRASKYGNKDAQKTIGMMYARGFEVDQNLAQAWAWLKLAKSTGDPQSHEWFDRISSIMTSEEMEQAEQDYQALQEFYGDVAALNHRAIWVSKQKRRTTGSRVGYVGFLTIHDPRTGLSVSGDHYYRKMKLYMTELEDYSGNVSLGDVQVKDD